MENDEEMIQTIRDLAGVDPLEQARSEKVVHAGEWLERKIEKKIRDGEEMTDAEIEGLARVIHQSLVEA